MAQATVELPDTATPDAANAGSADDLLSQMAGEEIDRLLADADKELAAGETAPAPAAPTAAADPALVANEPTVTAAASVGSDEVAKVESAAAAIAPVGVAASSAAAAPTTPAPAAAPAKEPSPEELAQAQLDALFNELSGGKPAEDTLAGAAETEGVAATQEDVDALLNAAANTVIPTEPAPAEAAPTSAALAATLVPPTDAPKSAALDAQLVQTLTDVAPSPVAPPAPVKSAEAATPIDQPLPSSPAEEAHGDPIYLKLLEMISAPLDSRPTLRDWIGKIGIVTAFNGFVILIYVFFFRG